MAARSARPAVRCSSRSEAARFTGTRSRFWIGQTITPRDDARSVRWTERLHRGTHRLHLAGPSRQHADDRDVEALRETREALPRSGAISRVAERVDEPARHRVDELVVARAGRLPGLERRELFPMAHPLEMRAVAARSGRPHQQGVREDLLRERAARGGHVVVDADADVLDQPHARSGLLPAPADLL